MRSFALSLLVGLALLGGTASAEQSQPASASAIAESANTASMAAERSAKAAAAAAKAAQMASEAASAAAAAAKKAAALAAGAAGSSAPMAGGTDAADGPTETRAIITTNFGEIEIRFFPDDAPKHVENFVSLAKSGFYDGTIFHRVIPGFMIQGGDPNTKDKDNVGAYGTGGPGHSVNAEFNKRSHVRGTVSMARSRDPNSAGSQFFIVVSPSTFLDGQYTLFGEVVRGIEVADKIVAVPRNRRDLPDERVEMTVKVVERPAT